MPWRAKVVGGLICILAVFLSGSSALGVEVQSIINNPSAYVNEVVTIEGIVVRHERDEATSTDFYVIRDDYGDELGGESRRISNGYTPIFCSKSKPSPGSRRSSCTRKAGIS